MSPWAKDQVELSNLLFEIVWGIERQTSGHCRSLCEIDLVERMLAPYFSDGQVIEGRGPLGATLLHWPIASERQTQILHASLLRCASNRGGGPLASQKGNVVRRRLSTFLRLWEVFVALWASFLRAPEVIPRRVAERF